MQKLMSLIGLTKRKAKAANKKDEGPPPGPPTQLEPFRPMTNEPTRPLYRIGDRKPSEIYKVIDLSG